MESQDFAKNTALKVRIRKSLFAARASLIAIHKNYFSILIKVVVNTTIFASAQVDASSTSCSVVNSNSQCDLKMFPDKTSLVSKGKKP